MKAYQKISEMLSTEKGRHRLLDLCDKFPVEIQNTVKNIESVPLCEIAWNASHRVNSSLKGIAEPGKLINPVELNRIYFDGKPFYWVHDGNHRVFEFNKAGAERIPAKITDFKIFPTILQKETNGDIALIIPGKDKTGSFVYRRITGETAELFQTLGLIEKNQQMNPVPQKNRKKSLLERLGVCR